MRSVIIACSVLFCVVQAVDYCKVCQNHTMCVYKDIGKNCSKTPPIILRRGLNNTEQKIVVDAHNELRNRVALGKEYHGHQPTASNMRKMVWNDELASFAQRWAEQCTFGHDSCRDTEKLKVMQNVYQGWYSQNLSSYDFDTYIGTWYDEVEKFDQKNINPYKFEMPTGHYTQIEWAESYMIGCGLFSYSTNICQYYFVCNYAPGGNMIGDPMYKVGKPASACPLGTSKDTTYQGLCA